MSATNAGSATPLLAALSVSPLARSLQRELRSRWPSTSDRVREMSRYALLAPGKALRPLLLVASADAVGGSRDGVLPAAMAVEYLHVATLVHDDVIDDDEFRRGQRSVHARYGTADAIVTGDFLILTVFTALAECADRGVPPADVLEAVRVLAGAGADVCRGQAKEAELTSDPATALADYEAMIALKTGALFRGVCRAGALLGGAAPEPAAALTRFAEHLGLAFQMYDDLLPYLWDSGSTGKPDTSDTENLRPTFPVLLGYQAAGRRDRERFARALSGRMPAQEAYALVRELLEATGALDRGRARAEAEAARAKEQLAGLPGSEGVELLTVVADLSTDRDR
ncbi:putative polyprenyl synthetase [Actinacidiphila reveromycinica]|uniref:Putative polyprenyl synthetase n=1 Tax=Actinacidiphila reveromycinica TaxID=659352 RepID=A0A7U3VS03_9ACTN|nr:polyprenyl synthetase family protein [Streptomyces sp. SN-593]BBB01324.1 putative polyprenyl synthetase [Streptomyces sp. SN-593]